MMIVMRIAIAMVVGLLLTVSAQAKEWRGIIPLHSTKADVENLLGAPPPPPKDGTRIYALNNARSIYFLDDAEVYIVFADLMTDWAAICGSKVPDGTVLLIEVTPKVKMPLSELHVVLSRFRTFDPSEPPGIGFMAYADEEEGMSFRTRDGKIEKINYYAAAVDRHQCPSYYSEQQNPNRFCDILVDFIREKEPNEKVRGQRKKPER